jgi:hypothetical protein
MQLNIKRLMDLGATVVFVTAVACPFVASARGRMLGRVRARVAWS